MLNCRSRRIFLICALCLTLLFSGLGLAPMAPAGAKASAKFASPTGSGTACTQSQPCSLATAVAQGFDNWPVYVAGGTYTGGTSPMLNVDKGIYLYGGWDGAPTGPVVVDPANHVSILDGQNTRQIIGVKDHDVDPAIYGFTFKRGSGTYGGAITVNDSYRVRIRDNKFLNNTANSGGAIFAEAGFIIIERNYFYGNIVVDYGGAMHLHGRTVAGYIGENEFVENSASNAGVAYFNDDAEIYFHDNIVRNSIVSGNAAVMLWGDEGDSEAWFYNNIFADNSRGALHTFRYTTEVYHNTFAKNGAITVEAALPGALHLRNNIFEGNNNCVEIDDMVSYISTKNLFWNNIHNNYPGTYPIFADPKFFGFYHLAADSPAINSADPIPDLTWDIDGQTRPKGPASDIGADEYGPIIFLPVVVRK